MAREKQEIIDDIKTSIRNHTWEILNKKDPLPNFAQSTNGRNTTTADWYMLKLDQFADALTVLANEINRHPERNNDRNSTLTQKELVEVEVYPEDWWDEDDYQLDDDDEIPF